MDYAKLVREESGENWDYVYKCYPEGAYKVEKNKVQGVYSVTEKKLIVPVAFELIQELIGSEYSIMKLPALDGAYRVRKDGKNAIFFPRTQTLKWEVAPFRLSDEDYAELKK